jgi:hypothetical protein
MSQEPNAEGHLEVASAGVFAGWTAILLIAIMVIFAGVMLFAGFSHPPVH